MCGKPLLLLMSRDGVIVSLFPLFLLFLTVLTVLSLFKEGLRRRVIASLWCHRLVIVVCYSSARCHRLVIPSTQA